MEEHSEHTIANPETLDIRTDSYHSSGGAIPQDLRELDHHTSIDLVDIQVGSRSPFHSDLNVVMLSLEGWDMLDRQRSLQCGYSDRWVGGHNTGDNYQ